MLVRGLGFDCKTRRHLFRPMADSACLSRAGLVLPTKQIDLRIEET